MQKPTLQTILVSILVIISLFVSIYFPYKWKQLSNDFLDQTNHYGELLKQINDLQKEVRELKNGEMEVAEFPNENLEKDETDETLDWKTYRNEKYGFEFEYPQDCFLKEAGKDYILLRRTKDEEFEWKIEIHVEGDSGFYNEEGKYVLSSILSFKEFIILEIKKSCGADGPGDSIYCTDIIKIEPFKSDQGLEGHTIFIKEIHKVYMMEKEEREQGPIFAFDISQRTTNLTRSIRFQLTREAEQSAEKENLIKILNQILSTFKFIE